MINTVEINVTVPGLLQEIDLGFRTEHLARCVVFDVSDWVGNYGATGSFALKHKPANSDLYYPIACGLDVATSTVTWDIKNTDTAAMGVGELQLIYAIGGTQTCSAIWQTYVHRSINTSAEAPDPYVDWVEDVQIAVQTATNAATTAGAKATAAESAASAAEDAAEDAAAAAESVSRTIDEQIIEYLNDPTHQEQIAALISSTALAAKVDKADMLEVLARY